LTGIVDDGRTVPHAGVLLSQQPPNIEFLPTGRFKIEVLVRPRSDSAFDFPSLLLERPGYSPETIELREGAPRFGQKGYKVTMNRKSRRIVIDEPVWLGKETAYAGVPK
jgi:hypothetical protein